jgi:hypothetical protein
VAGRILDAQLHLLDRQILDADDVPVTTVDDLELEGLELDGPEAGAPGSSGPGSAGPGSDGRGSDGRGLEGQIPEGTPAPRLTALVTGPVLGTRIFGGRPPSQRLLRVPWSAVSQVGTVLRLAVRAGSLDASWTERWARDRIIGRIPGGRHDPQ